MKRILELGSRIEILERGIIDTKKLLGKEIKKYLSEKGIVKGTSLKFKNIPLHFTGNFDVVKVNSVKVSLNVYVNKFTAKGSPTKATYPIYVDSLADIEKCLQVWQK